MDLTYGQCCESRQERCDTIYTIDIAFLFFDRDYVIIDEKILSHIVINRFIRAETSTFQEEPNSYTVVATKCSATIEQVSHTLAVAEMVITRAPLKS